MHLEQESIYKNLFEKSKITCGPDLPFKIVIRGSYTHLSEKSK